MNEDGALFDSGFDGVKPFRDTPEAGGISLESALRDFGPAALDDLIPRIRAIAAALDAAHSAGAVHGALHPSNVIIADDSTYLISGSSSSAPYIAPEVSDGEVPTRLSDQYALAAITYEWLFGRQVERSGRSVDVRNMPGVDRAALAGAFNRALSTNPTERFGSCGEFCGELSHATVPELPLLAFDAEEPAPAVDEPAASSDSSDLDLDLEAIERDEPRMDPPVAAAPDAPTFATTTRTVAAETYVPSARTSEPARFGGMALILATFVGAIFGFAAGYMARPRALQTAPPQEIATPAAAEAGKGAATAPVIKAPEPKTAPKARQAPKAPQSQRAAAPAKPAATTGALLIESRPTGASVMLNGASRGTTPLTIADLRPGDYRIVMSMPGFRNFATTVRVVAGERVRAAASLTALEQE